MEIAAEAKMHSVNARRDLALIWRRVVRARPPKWVVVVFCLGMMIAGFLGGWARGFVDGIENSREFNAQIQMRNLDQFQAGNPITTVAFVAQQVDWQVVDAAERLNPQSVSFLAWERLSPRWWRARDHEEARAKSLRDTAALRLKLPAPTAETLDAIKVNNRQWLVDRELQRLMPIAAAYSTILGREVPASALLTDAVLRRELISTHVR